MLKLFSTAALLLTFVVVTGCGPTTKPKAKISGQVNIDGKPLAEGEIFFVAGGDPPEILKITGGQFAGEVTQGEKKVEIRAYREGKAPATSTIKEKAPRENFVPAKYNEKTTLKANVTGSGIEPSKFDVTSS